MMDSALLVASNIEFHACLQLLLTKMLQTTGCRHLALLLCCILGSTLGIAIQANNSTLP